MRHSLIIIILFTFEQLFAQNATHKPNWNDTTLVLVNLHDTITDKKIAVIDIGQKATIYINEKILRQSATETLNDFNKSRFSKIINFLDSASLTTDTIIVYQFLYGLDYLVSEQLQVGQAKIYYKKIKAFVPTISHRLEKYGMYAHRFFYLPDKRPFFSSLEYSGIIENDKYHSDPSELVKLGEKLASLRKE